MDGLGRFWKLLEALFLSISDSWDLQTHSKLSRATPGDPESSQKTSWDMKAVKIDQYFASDQKSEKKQKALQQHKITYINVSINKFSFNSTKIQIAPATSNHQLHHHDFIPCPHSRSHTHHYSLSHIPPCVVTGCHTDKS